MALGSGHGPGHVHALFVHADSGVHRLRPQCKVVAALVFVLAVVATPRESFWAFGLYALVIAGVVGAARIRPLVVVRRLVIEVPFIAFAVFLPFLAGGERIDVVGVALSVDGLWAAWNIVIKGTLGVAATIVLAASTPVPDLLLGLDRLRAPRTLTAIAGFMIRYLDVVVGDVRRMRIARVSRGDDPRWFWQARAVAASAGSLFIRCYERGERVHLAMLSRGFDGAMPALGSGAASRGEWLTVMAVPAAAVAVSLGAIASRL